MDAAGVMGQGGDGMIGFAVLWVFALCSSKPAPEVLVAPC